MYGTSVTATVELPNVNFVTLYVAEDILELLTEVRLERHLELKQLCPEGQRVRVPKAAPPGADEQ